MTSRPRSTMQEAAAAIICLVAWATYVAAFGLAAVSDGDTESYRQFLVVRPLGYPLVLWLTEHGRLLPYFGAIQLAVMLAAFYALWRTVCRRLSPLWAWILLALCLLNVELVKYAFREIPEALFVSAITWQISALMNYLAERRGIFPLVISGAAIFLLRPAGVPLLLATALALAAYATPAAVARFVVGLLLLGWAAPSIANGVTRGFYAPQIYGGFHTIMPVINAVVSAPPQKILPPPLATWKERLRQMEDVYDHPSWPFQQALLQALASTYATQTLTPEFGAVESQSIGGLHDADERGREALSATLRAMPWRYVEGVSANAIGLLAAPGFIDTATEQRIAARLSAPTINDQLLVTETRKALAAQRVIPFWALAILRALGVAAAAAILIAALHLTIDLLSHIAARARKTLEYRTMLMRSAGTMIAGYVLMVGLVTAIPRFTLVIWPLLVLFVLVTMMPLIGRLGARFSVRPVPDAG